METASDKEWAQKYLLDPLTAPEPSQIHAQEAQTSKPRHSKSSSSSSGAVQRKPRPGDRTPTSSTTSKTGFSHNNSNLHTPPPSASPTSSSFHPTNPFSDQYAPPTPTRHATKRTTSDKSDSSTGSRNSGKASTPPSSSDRRPRAYSSLSPQEPTHHRSSSSSNGTGTNHRNLLANLPQRSASSGGNKHHHHQRNTSLPQRFPGDMSHRPLDMIKRETKVADRHPNHRSSHRRHRSAASQTDTIDALDTIGGSYHHGGPYDATLYSRNIHEKYSPLAAVRDSNMEAIRATPREFIQDSLQKHVPLQGTSTVPSGGHDLSGKRMDYREGADLMREPDAPGGAYKRWDGIQYHPDDLKGKGEPSYTLERDVKKMKQRDGLIHPEGIEMTGPFRPRSRSQGMADGHAHSSGLGVHRSNTTGKSGTSSKLSEGLKRRFGSIRKKKEIPVEAI